MGEYSLNRTDTPSTMTTLVLMLPTPSFVGGDPLGIKTARRAMGIGENANTVIQTPQNFLTSNAGLVSLSRLAGGVGEFYIHISVFRMLGFVVMNDWTVVVITAGGIW